MLADAMEAPVARNSPPGDLEDEDEAAFEPIDSQFPVAKPVSFKSRHLPALLYLSRINRLLVACLSIIHRLA